LTVDIYKGYAGITGEDGCVTFTNVPIGEYTSAEMPQDNWTYGTGLGGLTINGGENATVNVVNNHVPITGSLIVNKTAIGGDGMFTFTSQGPTTSVFHIMTVAGVGSTTLQNLTPGIYSITESNSDGWNLTTSTCSGVVVVAGQTASCSFVDTAQSSISGMKYEDKNRNGRMDPGEGGLSGWVIKLILENENEDSEVVIATTTTDGSGNYTFSNVAPGTYEVREKHQKGWKRTSKNPKDIVIVPGSIIKDVNFGNAKKKQFEREDTDKDDNRDEQEGKYYGNHERSNYENDQNDHGHSNGH
jgi:hypothetical protein